MKKMLSLFSAIMIRPTIYRAVTKCAVMLTVVLLWDRYVNKGLLPVGRDGCFVAALILFGLAWLNYLRLDIGNVEDFSPLSGLTALTELRFYGDYIIEDLSFLQGLTELHTLQMSGSGGEGAPVLDDLTALSGLTKLTDLQLRVPVASLDGLEGATALRTLRMYGSGSTYTDVDALAGLTGLVELNLEIRLKDESTGFINALADLPGVRSAVLVSYNGDYMG